MNEEEHVRARLIELYERTGNENFVRAALQLKAAGRDQADIWQLLNRERKKQRGHPSANLSARELDEYHDEMYRLLRSGQCRSHYGAAEVAVSRLGRRCFASILLRSSFWIKRKIRSRLRCSASSLASS